MSKETRPVSLPNEREAIARLRDRDIGGLQALVSKYQTEAGKAAYLVTGDRSTAEDVVATAFLRIYERIGQFDTSRPFRPWFMRIVANDAMKAVSRGNRLVPLDEGVEAAEFALRGALFSEEPGPEEMAEQAERRRRVWEAVQRLSPSQRSAIVLRCYLGLKEREIATQLGSSPGTVKRYLYEARKRLRLILQSVNLII